MRKQPCSYCGYVSPRSRSLIAHTFEGCAKRLVEQKAELLEALKVIMEGFESGVFVRDITKDSDSGWAVRLLPFIVAIGKAKIAIAKADPQ